MSENPFPVAESAIATPLWLAGQVLGPDEIPAAGAWLLPRAQRVALMLCLSGERLDYRRRCGWQHPGGSRRVKNRTIECLVRRGLVVVIRRSQFKKHARLTKDGAHYARTLVTRKMDDVRTILTLASGKAAT